jgi:serine/threonine kinase 16
VSFTTWQRITALSYFEGCVTQESDGSKTVYLFLPYYRRGNLQDAISQNAVNGTRFPEKDMLRLFLGTCEAVRAMHTYVPGPSATYPPGRTSSPAANSASSSKFTLADEEDEGIVGHNEESNLIKESEHTGAELEDDEGTHTIEGKLAPNPPPNTNTSNRQAEGQMQPWAHR